MENQTKTYNRKEFISFLGKVGLGAAIVPPFLVSCGNTSTPITKGELSTEQLQKLKSLVLEGFWAAIAIFGLVKALRMRKRRDTNKA